MMAKTFDLIQSNTTTQVTFARVHLAFELDEQTLVCTILIYLRKYCMIFVSF